MLAPAKGGGGIYCLQNIKVAKIWQNFEEIFLNLFWVIFYFFVGGGSPQFVLHISSIWV